jgi:hypothetical protein
LALSPQAALKTQDQFGNDSTVGLGASRIVSLTVSTGTGSLLGTTSQDIGTAAGNGIVTFSGLQVSMAGTGKQLSASSSGLTTALSSSFDVAKAMVTGSITANSKIYDGTTTATIATRALSGALAGDPVSLSGGTASFTSKSVGTAKPVTATGLTLSGAAAGNYQLASTSATALADITSRPLLVSATGANRVYDGTTAATVTLSDNRVAGDTLTTSYTTASFANKNIGTAKSISVGGISVAGTDAANYSANTSASTMADITARSLTVSATGTDKVYDATTQRHGDPVRQPRGRRYPDCQLYHRHLRQQECRHCQDHQCQRHYPQWRRCRQLHFQCLGQRHRQRHRRHSHRQCHRRQ